MGRVLQVVKEQKEISSAESTKISFIPLSFLGCLPFKTEYSDLLYEGDGSSLTYDEKHMSKVPLYNGCDVQTQINGHLKWLDDYNALDKDNYSVALALAHNLIRSNWQGEDSAFQRSVDFRNSRLAEFKTLFGKYSPLQTSALVAHKKMYRYIIDACYKRALRFDREFNNYVSLGSVKLPYKDEAYYIALMRESLRNFDRYSGKIGDQLISDKQLSDIYDAIMYHQSTKSTSFYSQEKQIFCHMTHSPLEVAFAFYLAYKLGWVVSLDEIAADYLDFDSLRSTDLYECEREKLFSVMTSDGSYQTLLETALGFKGKTTSNVLSSFNKSVVIGSVKTAAEFRLMSIFSQLGFACFDFTGLSFFELCSINGYRSVTRINNSQDPDLISKFNKNARLSERDADWYKTWFKITFGTSLHTLDCPPIVTDSSIKKEITNKKCVWVNSKVVNKTPPLFPNMLLEQIIFGYDSNKLIKAITAFAEY